MAGAQRPDLLVSMTDPRIPSEPTGCESRCRSERSVEALNRTCRCLSVDEGALRRLLEADLGVHGLSAAMVETHPHLFASLPVFIASAHIEQMARAIQAVEAVTEAAAFRQAAMSWAPDIAHFDPGSRGGLLGYDFHLTRSGVQLIEVNTNPGGALINAVLGRAQRACCADAIGLAMAPVDAGELEAALLEVFITEWRLQRGTATLGSVAIVDTAPEQQYLYPEFLLYRQLLERHGIQAMICDPHDLIARDGRLWHGARPVDFIYNRLTDFPLQQPEHAHLRAAYLANQVVLSPHPRAHALYADKRNLTLLSDETFLRTTGVSDDVVAALLRAIPRTERVTPANKDSMWADRRHLFFKPAGGYGSKAAYRGDKLTRRVWEEIAGGTYVAQTLVAPSERHVSVANAESALKVDIRNYAYAGSVKLVAARLYQGQTTNFRTPGGGFAPVLTTADDAN
jgi:hypothetical protein